MTMAGKWLPATELTQSGRPILKPSEVEHFLLSAVDVEPDPETHPSLSTYKSGLLTLTTHRLIWISTSSSNDAVFLSLSSITRIFPPKKSLKAAMMLASPRVRLEVSLSGSGFGGVGVVVVTLVMRGKGDNHELFYGKLWEAWRGRAWEGDVGEGERGESSSDGSTVAIRVPVVGVAGILRKEQEMWESTDKSLQDAFQDLNALMSKAKEMVMLAEKMRQKLLAGSNRDPSSASDQEIGSKEEMQDWLLSVGIISPVTKESAGALYHQQLSRQGLEDHLGDMDFKIAGTRNGITAIQLDIKPAGIPLDIICECLEPALRGRLQILDHMEHEIKAPRIDDDRNSPRLATLKYSNDSIRRFIGPLGALKRKIEEETGARISVDDGTLTIVAKNQSVMDKVQEKIDFVIGREIEVGGVYKGIVTTVKEYGAFVEFNGGQQGLLHISELSHEPVSRVSDVVSIGQQLSVMCIGQDVRGNIKLSLKAPLPHPIKKNGYVDDASAAPTKPTSQKWASVGDVSNRLAEQSNAEEPLVTEYEADEVKPSTSSTSFLIRSTSECDEEEKSDAVSQDDTVASSLNPSFLIRSAAECDEQEKSAGLRENCVGNPQVTSKIMSSQKDSSAARSTLSAKDLRLGTKVTAKVYQIRARGLVLDLGVGLKGMYRFETNGKRDFEVGDELRVQCSSFTAKGVPVMSSVKEE